jgi:hypothetical protein
MRATDMLKAIAVLNADLAAAVMKAANAGLDQAEIVAQLTKAAEILDNADDV